PAVLGLPRPNLFGDQPVPYHLPAEGNRVGRTVQGSPPPGRAGVQAERRRDAERPGGGAVPEASSRDSHGAGHRFRSPFVESVNTQRIAHSEQQIAPSYWPLDCARPAIARPGGSRRASSV